MIVDVDGVDGRVVGRTVVSAVTDVLVFDFVSRISLLREDFPTDSSGALESSTSSMSLRTAFSICPNAFFGACGSGGMRRVMSSPIPDPSGVR